MKTSHQSKNCKYRTFEKYNNAFLKYKQKINPACACANYLIHSFISFYLVIFELCIKSMAVKVWQYANQDDTDGNIIPLIRCVDLIHPFSWNQVKWENLLSLKFFVPFNFILETTIKLYDRMNEFE